MRTATFSASARLLSLCELAVTLAPKAFANMMPNEPRPPMPATPTFFAVTPAPFWMSGS